MLLYYIMTQRSRCSLSSLGDAPFVWQVRLKSLVMYILQRLFVLLLIHIYIYIYVCMYVYFVGLDV